MESAEAVIGIEEGRGLDNFRNTGKRVKASRQNSRG
jgi:hypothetical protein